MNTSVYFYIDFKALLVFLMLLCPPFDPISWTEPRLCV